MSDTPEGLTPKQERFCQEYLLDFNATQAAIRAEYHPKYAAGLLANPSIQERLRILSKERFKRLESKGDKVLRQALEIAGSDIYALLEVSESGAAKLLAKSKKTAKHRRAVQEFEYMEAPGEFGPMVKFKIKMHQKGPAHALLFKYFKLMESHGPDNGDARKTVKERVLAALYKARG